jgi:hypothetical protein
MTDRRETAPPAVGGTESRRVDRSSPRWRSQLTQSFGLRSDRFHPWAGTESQYQPPTPQRNAARPTAPPVVAW